MKTSLAITLLFLAAPAILIAQATDSTRLNLKAQEFLLFSFFRQQRAGTYLALSTDGLHWQTLNNDRPVLRPAVGNEKLMRDPSIHHGRDGKYRLVWTTDWKGKNIGYAESPDLLHWSRQKLIPVGKNIDSTNNCWAPEIFFDDLNDQYMIYWSSNVGEWKKTGSEGRIYYVMTKDFNTFSQPKILFRNGFPAGGDPGNDGPIDAFIYKDGNERYILFYKKDDNSKVPNLYYRTGRTPQGPWQQESPVITPSTGDEGPSCIRMGNQYMVFTDPFESNYAYRFSSTDLLNWKRHATDLLMSHGTVIKISNPAAMALLGRK